MSENAKDLYEDFKREYVSFKVRKERKTMKVNFDVTITRTGFITVKAEDEEETMRIVNELPIEEIQRGANWLDAVGATDAEPEMDV